MVMTAGARLARAGGLPVLLQQLVAFHLSQTTLLLHKNIKYKGLCFQLNVLKLLDWFWAF